MSATNNLPYTVLIMNWVNNETHWVKGFESLYEAQNAVLNKHAEHQGIENHVVILKGEIKQFGITTPED